MRSVKGKMGRDPYEHVLIQNMPGCTAEPTMDTWHTFPRHQVSLIRNTIINFI